jgi:hypothetical protein
MVTLATWFNLNSEFAFDNRTILLSEYMRGLTGSRYSAYLYIRAAQFAMALSTSNGYRQATLYAANIFIASLEHFIRIVPNSRAVFGIVNYTRRTSGGLVESLFGILDFSAITRGQAITRYAPVLQFTYSSTRATPQMYLDFMQFVLSLGVPAYRNALIAYNHYLDNTTRIQIESGVYQFVNDGTGAQFTTIPTVRFSPRDIRHRFNRRNRHLRSRIARFSNRNQPRSQIYIISSAINPTVNAPDID